MGCTVLASRSAVVALRDGTSLLVDVCQGAIYFVVSIMTKPTANVAVKFGMSLCKTIREKPNFEWLARCGMRRSCQLAGYDPAAAGSVPRASAKAMQNRRKSRIVERRLTCMGAGADPVAADASIAGELLAVSQHHGGGGMVSLVWCCSRRKIDAAGSCGVASEVTL
jgi:hypothetical protein